MAAYRLVYDSRDHGHLQADCQEPGSVPEPHARISSMGYRAFLDTSVLLYSVQEPDDAASVRAHIGVERRIEPAPAVMQRPGRSDRHQQGVVRQTRRRSVLTLNPLSRLQF